MSYCQHSQKDTTHFVHKEYHDKEYGFPIESDDELFGRLILEINQAGLSWETILKKKDNFRSAYAGFSIKKVADFSEEDRQRLLNDAGIIRNKLKINAAIHNANAILEIQNEFGSFKDWLNIHFPQKKENWVKLFKKRFKFVGGEIVNEFLMSIGYLSGAHEKNCPIFDVIEKLNPKWKEI